MAVIRNPDVDGARGLGVVRDAIRRSALGDDVAEGVGALAGGRGVILGRGAILLGRVGDGAHQPAGAAPGRRGGDFGLGVVVGDGLDLGLGHGSRAGFLGGRSGRACVGRGGSLFLGLRGCLGSSAFGLGSVTGVLRTRDGLTSLVVRRGLGGVRRRDVLRPVGLVRGVLRLGQGLQEVLERERDRAEVDVAVRVVRGGGALGHGCAVLARHGELELAGDVGALKARVDAEALGARESDGDGLARRVRVEEREVTVREVRGASQLSVAVIHNGHVEGEARRRGRHTLVAETVSHLVCNVRDGPGVAGARGETVANKAREHIALVGQGSEVNLTGDVRSSGNDLVGVLAVNQAEVEVVVEHEAVRHGLRANDGRRRPRGGIGVHEGDLRSGVRVRTGNVGIRVVDTRRARDVRRYRELGGRGVISRGDLDVVARCVIDDAAKIASLLGNGVGVDLPHVFLGKRDARGRAHHKGLSPVGSLGVGVVPGDAELVVAGSGDVELKLARGQRAAAHLLRNAQSASRGVVKLRAIRVREDVALVRHVGAHRAVALVSDRYGHRRGMLVVRDSGDTGGILGDLVFEGAGAVAHHVIGERDGAEREVIGLALVVDGHGGDFLAVVINGEGRAGGLGGDREAELVAIPPVAAHKPLGEVRVHELVFRDAGVIGVDELPVSGDEPDGCLELAGLCVVSHGDAEGGDVVAIAHATGASTLLGDPVVVLARLRVHDGAKVDLGRAVDDVIGTDDNTRGGSAVVTHGDGSAAHALEQEGEAVAILPVATLKDLRQAEVRRGEAGVRRLVGVLEQNLAVVVIHNLAVDLRRNRQRAVEVINDGDDYLVRVFVIGNAGDLILIGRNDLCHVERVGLVGVHRVKDHARQLRHVLGDAACAPLGVGEALVGIGEQAICFVSRRSSSSGLGGGILARNGEGEHAHFHRATGENLAHSKTGIVGNLGGRVDVRKGRVIGNDLVRIDRGGRVVIGDVPKDEHAVVVNDSDGCGSDVAVPRDACAILGRSLLTNSESVLAGLGERHLAGLKVDHVAVGLMGEGHLGGDAILRAGDEAQGELEVIRVEHVSTDELLLALDDPRLGEGRGLVGVLESGRGSLGGLTLTRVGRGDLNEVLAIDGLVGHGHGRDPNRAVITHAGTSIIGGLLGDLVLVGLAHVLTREGDSLEDHDAMGVVVANELGRATGHGSVANGRQGELEHAGLERQRAGGVVQLLHGDGRPVLRGGVENVHEGGGSCGRVLGSHVVAKLVVAARDLGGNRERSVVVVRDRHGHGVEGEGRRDASRPGFLCRLIDLIDIGAGLLVGDVTEVEGDVSARGRAFGARDCQPIDVTLGPLRHGGAVEALEDERKAIGGEPVASVEDLLAHEGVLAGERASRGVRVREFCLGLDASLGRALAGGGGGGRGKAGGGALGHGVGDTGVDAVHVERLTVLERVLGMAVGVEREVPRLVATDFPVDALDGRLEGLAGGVGDGDVEREVEVVVVRLVKAIGDDYRLGNRERGGLLERDPTIVAKGNVDRLAIPVRIDDGRGGIRSVGILVGTQLVDIGETAGTLFQNEISRFIGANSAGNTLGNTTGEGNRLRSLSGLSISNVIPRTLVVIRHRAAQWTTSALSALGVEVERSVFGDVVVPVTRRGSERGHRVAIRPTGVRVREEVDLPLLIRVAGNVICHVLIGIREEVNHLFLEA